MKAEIKNFPKMYNGQDCYGITYIKHHALEICSICDAGAINEDVKSVIEEDDTHVFVLLGSSEASEWIILMTKSLDVIAKYLEEHPIIYDPTEDEYYSLCDYNVLRYELK